MLKTVFTLKYFYIGIAFGAFLLATGTIGLSSTDKKDLLYGVFMLLLGISALVIALWNLFKRLKGRREILGSSDYEAMESDFALANPFMDGEIYVGKCYLFSKYAGRIIRCEDVMGLHEEVNSPLRGYPTAKLTADISGEAGVVLAKYTYWEKNKDEADRLDRAIKLIKE